MNLKYDKLCVTVNSSSNQSEPIELVINIVKSISFARSGVTYKPAGMSYSYLNFNVIH